MQNIEYYSFWPSIRNRVDCCIGCICSIYVPKLVNLQLSIDNHVIWKNVDETAHTVTPDHRYTDGYSGDFGSTGVVKPGEEYEFLFTEAPPNTPVTIEYHCDPHPWMKAKVVVSKARF